MLKPPTRVYAQSNTMPSRSTDTHPDGNAQSLSDGLSNDGSIVEHAKSCWKLITLNPHGTLGHFAVLFGDVGRYGSPAAVITNAKAPLLKLPIEVIEVISDYLRYAADGPEPRTNSHSQRQLPPMTRDLSRFSLVCKYIRWSVEPRLYRDIHVDFSGWVIPSHLMPQYRPPCRLNLLLRTLAERGDLRGYVKTVRMEWPGEDTVHLEQDDLERIGREFCHFFSFCASVETFLIPGFPLGLFLAMPKLPSIKEVMTASFQDALRALVETFPGLQTLYLDIDEMDTFPERTFPHQLKSLHLYVPAPFLIEYLVCALEVCGDITEELHISSEGSGFNTRMNSTEITLSRLAGANLRSLRLHGEGFNILGHPNRTMAYLIQVLPSLNHLHVSQPATIDPTAFSILPPSIRSLYLSDYGSWLGPVSSRHAFVRSLCRCLERNVDRVKSVSVFGLTKATLENNSMGDLGPLSEACKGLDIPLSLDICQFPQFQLTMGQLEELKPEIRILFN